MTIPEAALNEFRTSVRGEILLPGPLPSGT